VTSPPGSRLSVDSAVLDDFLVRRSDEPPPVPVVAAPVVAESARNRFRGIVTRVTRDKVMAQVGRRPVRSGWCP
jgi:hypothetical protein